MKRLGGLFESIASRDNLWSAWLDFRCGKRQRRSVLAFEHEADREVLSLSRQLEDGTYEHSGYQLFVVREPKRRLIAAASVRDRVVHHAVHRVLAPLLDPRLTDHTYACLPGRGTHRALLACQRGFRRHRFYLQLDIRHYFLSIDRQILMQVMARYLKDRDLLALLQTISDSGTGLYDDPEARALLHLEPGFPGPGRGLPIGNLTSQWWGNHYLSAADHLIKRNLGIPQAQRYMDDMILFADNARRLREARDVLADWLTRERRLELKDPTAKPWPTTRPTRYLGHLVGRDHLKPLPTVAARARRRVAHLAVHGDYESVCRGIAATTALLAGPINRTGGAS